MLLAQALYTWGASERLRLTADPSALQKAVEALQERTALSLCPPDIGHPTSLQGQVAFLVADQSRHPQHRPVQMGNAGFHAALLKIHNFKAYTRLAMGSQSAFEGAGYTQQNGSAQGRQEEPQKQCLRQAEGMRTRLHPTLHSPFPAPDLCPRQVPFSSSPEVPGHKLTPGTLTATRKGTGAAGAGCARPPSPGLSPWEHSAAVIRKHWQI